MRIAPLVVLLLLSAEALAAPLAVEVRTADAEGKEKTVSGARVAVFPAGKVVFAENALRDSRHETDGEGRVDVPRPEGRVLVLAGIPGRGTAHVLVDPVEPQVTILLPAEAVMSVLVLGPDERPVQAAEVFLVPERATDTQGFITPGAPVFRDFTDRAGSVAFYRLAEGTRYRLMARAPGLARSILRDLLPAERPHEVTLTPGARIKGQLMSVPDGDPVVGAVVSLGDLATLSGEDGSFEISGVSPGSYRLGVKAAGHLHVEETEIVLAEGDVREGLVIQLLGMGRLKGRVLSPATRSAAGAEIYLRYPPDPDLADRLPPNRIVRAGTTDAEGRFDAKGLIPAQGVDVIARHPEWAPATYRGYSILAAQTIETVILLRRGGVVSGRALDPASEGVAGVRVIVLDDREDLSKLLAGEEFFSPAMREAVTDEKGAYRVQDLSGGKKAVVALKKGFLPYVVRGIDVAEEEQREGLTLFLGAGALVSGSVRDAEKRPVPGARLTLLAPLGPPRQTTSDEQGAFEISSVPAGPYVLRVTADGFAPYELASVTAPTENLDITLSRGGGFTGRVLEEDSRERVPDATVRALRRDEPTALDPDRPVYREVARVRAVGAGGTFALADLPVGTYRVEAWSGDGMSGFVDRVVLGPAGEGAQIEIRVYAGWAITGRVIRSHDGQAVEGATVAIRGAGDDPGPHSAVTDGGGEFRIPGVPPGFHTLLVVARDLAPRLVSSVEVKRAAETRVPDIELLSGATIRGIVTGSDARVRAGTEVRLSSAALGGERKALTDEGGSFSFTHVSPGSYLLATDDPVSAPGGRRYERLIDVSEGDEIILALGSGNGTALTGQITAGGVPVAHAHLRALRISHDVTKERHVFTTRTDADGNYLLPDLMPGHLLLLVTPLGSTLAPIRLPVEVLPGPVMILDLVLPDSGIEGIVTDVDTGEPIAGATLLLTREAGGSEGTFLARLTREAGEVTSGPDGTFLFSAIPPGDYRIDAYRSGFGQTEGGSIRVTSGGFSTARLDMPPAGILEGRVLTDDGRPVTDARVAFLDARGRFATREAWIEVDSGGRFRVDSLKTGRYTLEVRAPGHAVARKTGVDVFPGGHPAVEIALAPEGRLEVTVYGVGGVLKEGARVSMVDFWGRPVPFPEPPVGLLTPYVDPAVTDADGRVVISNLPAGIYLVGATLEGHRCDPSRVRVLDGEISRGAIVLLPRSQGR